MVRNAFFIDMNASDSKSRTNGAARARRKLCAHEGSPRRSFAISRATPGQSGGPRLALFDGMRMNEIMTSPVETVSPSESAELAWGRLKRGRFHHLVVVDGKRVVGVISAHDLGGSDVGSAVRKERSVGELMTPAPVCVDETLTVRQAANRLRGRAIGCLPILRDGRLVGIVTTTDLLDALGSGTQRPVERGERWTLKHRGPRHRPAPVGVR